MNRRKYFHWQLLIVSVLMLLLFSFVAWAAPASVTLVGDLQSELGCPGDWDPTCADTHLIEIGNDVWRAEFPVPLGTWQYKNALNDAWDESYPAANKELSIGADTLVRFYFDDKTKAVVDSVNDEVPVAAGTFQNELGCPGDWQADCVNTLLTDVDGDGLYSFVTTAIPAGGHEFKVAMDEDWAVSFPGGNVPFMVNDVGELVTITYDSGTNDVTVVVGQDASHDNDVWWNDLGHNSRDTLYRTPYGPVTTGTAVTLRFRAASGDLTAAQVRLWNDRPNTEQFLDMVLIGDDGTYEWWEAEVPASVDPTVYWYRFIAIDGTATAYYEDDEARDHGWGQTFGDSPDNGWQITVYDPAFQTPDWVKNGIMYQIFPDRFRDGDPSNNTPAGEFFYNENPTIERSNDINGYWNAVICDPRESTSDCPNIYSQNFYGGDLQGVFDKLDYLQDLGVTVIYFNPIFKSPSNHKYDTTDYSLIDDNFGDLATFQLLVDEAHARGMKIVLDGVFNHTSSDSIYFDRYGRYASVGACESETSDYRDWYYFTDVTPGTGSCVGSDGTPDAATYESWFGFDSLPKLQAHNPDVRALIWDSPDSIVNQWLATGVDGWRFDVGGDIDPGVTNDPANDYWEGFRSAVRANYPDTYMVIEEWGNASSWLLGNEMDATMNYQYSSAMLSFWRDTDFTDNDHNEGSSAGVLTPLTPSQLDARLRNWEERYPPEAYYAMMNLLGSHDTNRPLFFLEHNDELNDDPLLLEDPNYDWSDAITRQKGVVLLQMTLPGAPTIYYGDEVGLVGPTYYHGDRWEDDPYNRIPYPWLDESGTPFYTHLQAGGTGHTELLPYYQSLTALRNSHPALRTGSFVTLLADDANNVYAYARIADGYSDAAVVIVNRAGGAQDVTLNVAGTLPGGTEFEDALNGGLFRVDGAGQLTVTAVPGMSGSVLVPTGAMTPPPTPGNDLAVTDVRSDAVDLGWSAAAGADSYDVYRSQFSGGGYELIANTAANSYSDTGLMTAVTYYYVVVSRNDTTLLVSAFSNEVSATPAYTIGWANLQWPPTINHTISAVNPTENIYGQIWISGFTDASSEPVPNLLAEVGYGSDTTPVGDGWIWFPMEPNPGYDFSQNNDEYTGTLLPDMLGTYCYTTRYSGDGGNSWFYAANGPDEGNPTCPGPFGVLDVVLSADVTAPAAPTNLSLTGTTNSSISLAWDAHPNTDGDLFGFEVYREDVAMPGFIRVATIADPAATTYTDTTVTTGETYNYYVVAFDDSYNRSAASNMVQATAEPRFVSVTFLVGVPDYTPGTVHLVGDIPELGPWNPGLVPMSQVDATTWSYTLDLLDGTQMQYKYTRGSWDMVESWGSITGLNNRSLTISYGSDGTQLVDNTATDWGTGPDDEKAVEFWRDPLVVDFLPADGAIDVARDVQISVVWSIPMEPDTSFEVMGPDGLVPGTFNYVEADQTVFFTPDADLAPGATYVVTVAGALSVGVAGGDTGVQQSPVVWSFTTGNLIYISSNSGGFAGDVWYADEDILTYDTVSGEWHVWFDGSDVGLRRTDVDALHPMEDGAVLMSFNYPITLPGLGLVDDSDIVQFNPTSLGEDTAGTWEWFFDGSDVGLTIPGEDVDAIGFAPDGRLLISVVAAAFVPGAFGADDDLLAFDATGLGENTSGDWEKYFDGSDVWHFTEDVWGTWLDAATGDIYFALQNSFTAGDVVGDSLDIFICQPLTLGSDTDCAFGPDLYFDGSEAGFCGNRIDGFAVER